MLGLEAVVYLQFCLGLVIGVRVGLVGVGVRAGCLFAVLFRVGD